MNKSIKLFSSIYEPLKAIMTKLNPLISSARLRCGYPASNDGQANLSRLPKNMKREALNIREELKELYDLPLNNAGSPFGQASYSWHLQTHEAEKIILQRFAKHFSIEQPVTGHTTASCTESNMTSVWWARRWLENHSLSKPSTLICSRESHYCFSKIANIMQLKLVNIETTDGGEVCLQAFREYISNCDPTIPIIYIANIGTTRQCALDDVEQIHQILINHYKHNNKFSIHLDAALMGLFIPAMIKKRYLNNIFKLQGIRSISISGHKLLGTTIPSGIFMAFNGLNFTNAENASYLGNQHDNCVSGSRSGHAPLEILLRTCELGVGFEQSTLEDLYQLCCDNAAYLTKQLTLISNQIHVYYQPPGLQVVIQIPDKQLITKYQLMPMDRDGQYAGIYALPHVTKAKLMQFVEDYRKAYQTKILIEETEKTESFLFKHIDSIAWITNDDEPLGDHV